MDASTNNLLTIDGSLGEGGGQILRTSLTLAILHRRPIRIVKIRAGRSKPGLMRQHLTCVQAAAAISCGEIRGAELGASEFEFVPHLNRGGHYTFKIGSAGSVILVLQTILPALLMADRESHVTLEGGTHVMNAPSFDFIAQAFVPMLTRMGAKLELQLEQPGFFPVGGGRVVCSITPSALHRIALPARGRLRNLHAFARSAGVPAHVGERECARVREHFDLKPDAVQSHDHGRLFSSGNALTVVAEFEHSVEAVTALGERGLPAETVADRACAELNAFVRSDASVGEHLSDQLLLPMVLAGGGSFTVNAVSSHLQSNAAVIEQFGAARVEIVPLQNHTLHQVTVRVGS